MSHAFPCRYIINLSGSHPFAEAAGGAGGFEHFVGTVHSASAREIQRETRGSH